MADIISNVFNENDEFSAPILSDNECAEELQYQEVLAASLEIFNLHMSTTQIEESPESSQGFCEICMETKATNEMFKLENCSRHSFCTDCIAQYVQFMIQDHIFSVTCPGLKCCATIEPVYCKSIIPENVFEKWQGGLSESSLLECEKFYCPYKDCSELLIYDHDQGIIECICPVCHRLLCAACGVPWHTGLDCDKFQNDEKNREDDLKVEELASSSKWMKCPHCKHIVQKADGCIHITCWMGRVRLSVKRLESHSNRQSTYCKRRCGILKKAQEISVLCDIDIILLLFSPTGKPTLFQGGQSWWSNPDNINKVEDFALMECALRESLNAVHVRKLQKTTHLHLLMNSELDGNTHQWHPENKILRMPFPQTPNILPQEALEKLIKQDRTQLQC